ncbi:hypothetical protein V1512DRAFT_143877 [Lipomyces arxii]|uniref:uncharacterized protein n=1 Tax=Lipomyces arxii TaxID=56418 RepID=UPI0034CF8A29
MDLAKVSAPDCTSDGEARYVTWGNLIQPILIYPRLVQISRDIRNILDLVENDRLSNALKSGDMLTHLAEEAFKLRSTNRLNELDHKALSTIEQDLKTIHAVASHVAQLERDIETLTAIKMLHNENGRKMMQKLRSEVPSDPSAFKSSKIPRASKYVLRTWMKKNQNHPYPTSSEKSHLQNLTGVNRRQIDHWFKNARRRSSTALVSQDLQCIFGFSFDDEKH